LTRSASSERKKKHKMTVDVDRWVMMHHS